jgi:hypothetical protein
MTFALVRWRSAGLDWQVAGFGDFNHDGTTDMMLYNNSSGSTAVFEVYDISNHQVISANSLGAVGSNWQVAGFGDFNSDGTTDMMLRNSSNGAFEVYDINNNMITSASVIGQVRNDWQVAGFGPMQGPGTSDMVLRNVNTGAFEVYDIANNQITGAALLGSVGLDWQLGGFAADPPSAPASGSEGLTSQLVQAMAGFGGSSGTADGLKAAPLGADTSEQTLLTTPHG